MVTDAQRKFLAMSVDLMQQIDARARAEKEKVFYARTGEITFEPVNEQHLLFRKARDNNRGVLEIQRLLVCNENPTKKPSRGLQYFTPLYKKNAVAKYYHVLFSCETVYEIGARYGIGPRV